MRIQEIRYVLAAGLLGIIMSSCASKDTEVVSEIESPKIETSLPTTDTGKVATVAIINSDTILANYELASQLRDQLTEQSLKYENVLRQKEQNLRSDLERLQAEAPKLSQFEGQTRQRKLYEEQERFQQLQEEYSQKLAVQEQAYNREIDAAINQFLEKYCADKTYEIVLSNSELGMIRWVHKSLDITQPVLEGLNEEYRAQKTNSK